MKEDEYDLDRVLAEREEIIPSSGFVASVMEAVREEAAAPAPIPFPWKWALPGLAVSVLLVLMLLVRWTYASAHVWMYAGGSAGFSANVGQSARQFVASMLLGPTANSIDLAIEWSVMALLVSLAAIWLSMRIASTKN